MSEIAKRLLAFASQLEEMPEKVSDVAKLTAEKLQLLVDKQFSQGVSPRGERWIPLSPATVLRTGPRLPLTDTGAMRGSVTVSASGDEITLAVNEPAVHHQFGTRNMPARPILSGGGTMPKDWADAVADSVKEVLGDKS